MVVNLWQNLSSISVDLLDQARVEPMIRARSAGHFALDSRQTFCDITQPNTPDLRLRGREERIAPRGPFHAQTTFQYPDRVAGGCSCAGRARRRWLEDAQSEPIFQEGRPTYERSHI